MKKGCLITFVAVIGLMTIGLVYYFYKQNSSDSKAYKTEKPVLSDIIKKTIATGSIRPRQEVKIKSQVSGVVDELYVEAGDLVKKGQKIARIQLIPNQLNINTAQSNVALARIRVEESDRELERQKEVFSKKLDVESARANYENDKIEEDRQKKLFEDGIIADQTYNNFKLKLEVSKTAFDNAQIASANSLKQFETTAGIRRQELDAAINNLQLLQEGASKKSRQVANIVVSTVDGMVLDVTGKEGTSVIERNNFNDGTTIADIANMDDLIFEGKVDESDVGKIKEGMPIKLTIGAIDGLEFDAILEHIAPKGIEEEGTVKFEVRAAVKPTKEVFLRAGYSANGDIILAKKIQVVSIKERDLIIENDSIYFVEVKTGDQEFEKRKIEVGLSDGIQIEIKNGIDTTTKVKVQTVAKEEEEKDEGRRGR